MDVDDEDDSAVEVFAESGSDNDSSRYEDENDDEEDRRARGTHMLSSCDQTART